MTYEAFVARSLKMQARYITQERARYEQLDLLRKKHGSVGCARGAEPEAYKRAAARLGLHAQQVDEIVARLTQLDGMLDRLNETHGDNPGQRAAYAMAYGA